MIRYIFSIALVFGVEASLAPFIHPCTAGNIMCILRSAQVAAPELAMGIPSLGIPPLDPMHINSIKSTQGGLKLMFRDVTVRGLKDCRILNMTQNLEMGKQTVTAQCSVQLEGRYRLDGRLILLPIQGDSTFHIKIHDMVIKTNVDMTTVVLADGKRHWHINNWDHTYKTKGGAEFKFHNLFHGNQFLAQPVEQFLNTNWREVMEEVAPPIVKIIASKVIQTIELLYKAVPVANLILD